MDRFYFSFSTYLDEADERDESCILDIVENGVQFADAASGDESPGSQVDSRLSLLLIYK